MHSIIERKVERLPTYPLSPHTHSLPALSASPPDGALVADELMNLH